MMKDPYSATLVWSVVLQNHVKKTMEKGLYQLEDGELVPEPTLETKYFVFLLFHNLFLAVLTESVTFCFMYKVRFCQNSLKDGFLQFCDQIVDFTVKIYLHIKISKSLLPGIVGNSHFKDFNVSCIFKSLVLQVFSSLLRSSKYCP